MKWDFYFDVYPWTTEGHYPPVPTLSPSLPKPEGCKRYRFNVSVDDPFDADVQVAVKGEEVK